MVDPVESFSYLGNELNPALDLKDTIHDRLSKALAQQNMDRISSVV